MKRLNVAKKVVLLFLVFSTLMMSSMVFAGNESRVEENETTSDDMRWSYLASCANYLMESTDYTNALYIMGRTFVDDGYCADVSVQLQKKSGSTWSDVSGEYWYDYSSNEIAFVSYEPVYVNAGTYRLKVLHKACDAYGVILETYTSYSNTVTI